MKRFRKLSIKKRLTLFFLVFFCIPFLAIGLIWYNKTTGALENSAISYNEQLMLQLSGRLDEFYTRIKLDTQTLPGNSLIQQFIRLDPSETYELFQLKESISREVYPYIAYRNKEFVGFYVQSAKGGGLGDLIAGTRTIDYRDWNLTDESFQVLAVQRVGDVPVILFYRNINDRITYQPAGAMISAFDLDQILNISNAERIGQKGRIAIADANRRFLYHSDPDEWGNALPASWQNRMEGQGGYFMDHTGGDKKIVVYRTSENTHLTMITELSYNELVGGLPNLRTVTIIIALLILILAYITFGKMLLEIKRLVEVIHISRLKEKELELKQREAILGSLQSQINPHFLYNSLEIINSYAIVAKVRPISQMTVTLANMFRYSVNDPNEPVSLGDEIDHCRSYMRIQSERYEDLRVVIELETDTSGEAELFRLTLQPLLENAIIHAYEKHGLHPGEIRIVGSALPDYYSLRVIDKGRGMPPELAAWYNAEFERDSDSRLARGLPSIGLWNVHSRLRLKFGQPYGLRILRSGAGGTDVEVRLPYRKAE
ncbi:cache domain-containing sensor histidine kinase [Paenibacillus ginsengarvi]|uniref:Sensor histidine kinase n=1 Tax=Paenibacillus ginsengarvi TaxID=400777 RepID=A0A3B0BC54_9BACL|nr:sensor histidine kinase [Paenibacillus ginsengarvi]RKN70049.1 sensor histidine kinase [Paenibacillus ginsengarvi]